MSIAQSAIRGPFLCQTPSGLKRLMEVVADGSGTLAIILAGHPKLRNDLRRPTMKEEIGYRSVHFTLDGAIEDRPADVTWLIVACKAKDAAVASMIDDAAIALLAARLRTALGLAFWSSARCNGLPRWPLWKRCGTPQRQRTALESAVRIVGFVDAQLPALGACVSTRTNKNTSRRSRSSRQGSAVWNASACWPFATIGQDAALEKALIILSRLPKAHHAAGATRLRGRNHFSIIPHREGGPRNTLPFSPAAFHQPQNEAEANLWLHRYPSAMRSTMSVPSVAGLPRDDALRLIKRAFDRPTDPCSSSMRVNRHAPVCVRPGSEMHLVGALKARSTTVSALLSVTVNLSPHATKIAKVARHCLQSRATRLS
jgi:hypothetical protein